MDKSTREEIKRLSQPALNIVKIARDKYAPQLREIRIYIDFRGEPSANVQLLGKDSSSFKAHGDYFDNDKWEDIMKDVVDFRYGITCIEPAWEWAREE